ncbi:hypothetical protein [Aeromonas jandaei]|uniref:hypothetical protein n=1 Tax=Aeromonas jandaei TaxID=650 RepID=UPI003BA18934
MIKENLSLGLSSNVGNLEWTPSVYIKHKLRELEYFVKSYFTIRYGRVDTFSKDAQDTLLSIEKIIALYDGSVSYSRSLAFMDEFFDTAVIVFKNSSYDQNRNVFKDRLGWEGRKDFKYSSRADEDFINFFFNLLPDLTKQLNDIFVTQRANDKSQNTILELKGETYKLIGAAIVSYHASRHEELMVASVDFVNHDAESKLTKISSELKTNAKVEINDFLNILMKKKSDEISLIKTDYKNFNEHYKTEFDNLIEKKNESDLLSKEIMKKADALLESAKDIHGKTNRQAMAGTFDKISKELILPQCLWSCGLLISLVAIFSIGMYFYLYSTEELTVTQLVARVFLITPMVWLAWFSGRQYNHTSKLRQDYRYKSAVAMAYHGYKSETGEDNDEMHTHLLQNIVAHFSDNPVRLYDKVESSMPVEEFLKKISPDHVVDIWKTVIQAKDGKESKAK